MTIGTQHLHGKSSAIRCSPNAWNTTRHCSNASTGAADYRDSGRYARYFQDLRAAQDQAMPVGPAPAQR
jgi:hypothetical protein